MEDCGGLPASRGGPATTSSSTPHHHLTHTHRPPPPPQTVAPSDGPPGRCHKGPPPRSQPGGCCSGQREGSPRGAADCRVLVVGGEESARAAAGVLATRGYHHALGALGDCAKLADVMASSSPPHLLLVTVSGGAETLPPAVREVLSCQQQPRPAVVALLASRVRHSLSAPHAHDPRSLAARRSLLAVGVADVIDAPLSSRDADELWKSASVRRSASAELPSRLCAEFATTEESPATLYTTTTTTSTATPGQQECRGTCLRRTSMLDAMGGGEPSCSPDRPLLAWLSERGAVPNGAAAAPTTTTTTTYVFYSMLSHVAEHHANYGTPWGLSLLHNFVVLPNDEVTCCIPTSTGSPVVGGEQAELFAAPEGANSGTAADVYTLGCVFFRMLYRLPPKADARQVMVELRNRILPITFLQQQPVASAFVLAMLHPNPSCRPSVDDLMAHDLLAAAAEEFSRRKLASRGSRERLLAEAAAKREAERPEAAVPENRRGGASTWPPSMEGQQGLDLERASVVTDIMAAFLQQMHAQLLEQHSDLLQQRTLIDADLAEVTRCASRMCAGHREFGDRSSQSAPQPRTDSLGGASTDGKRRRTCPGGKRPSMEMLLGSEAGLKEVDSSGCFLRDDMDIFSCIEPQLGELEARVPQSPAEDEEAAGVEARWSRLQKQLPIMESMYLQRCQQAARSQEHSPPSRGAGVLRGHLAAFAKDLNKFSKFGKLLKHASLVQSSLHVSQASHMICSMAFGCEDHMFATAGTATRKIKLYQVAPLLRHRGEDGCVGGPCRGAAAHYPLMELETGDKLSSVSWNRYLRNYLVSSDYSGVVALWDTGKGELVTQFAEHSKRLWSADFSTLDPKMIVSGGDDASVRLWSVSEPCSTLALNLCAPVYSVKFSPTNANLLAVGCANYRSYLYDIRNTGTPLLQIAGHKKAVSYVRFLGPDQLLTASIDSTVKHWDVPASLEQGDAARLRCCYRDHVNEKCFVGLDVREDGYILAGSETNEVACYYSGLPAPVLRHSFSNGHHVAGRRPAASSVAWSTTSNLFLAANSAGSVELLEMTSC